MKPALERLAVHRVDKHPREWDKQGLKGAKKAVEKKTPGALIVEKYPPRMNKLTRAERRQLRERAMRIAFGHEPESAPNPGR